MEICAQPVGVGPVEKEMLAEWVLQIFTDVPLNPQDCLTLELIKTALVVENQRVSDKCIAKLVNQFHVEGKARRRQCELLEFCLGQLKSRFQIDASPSPRVLISEPERHYLDISQGRYLPIISTVLSVLGESQPVTILGNWSHRDFSVFLLRLIFELRLLNPRQLERVVARHYQLVSLEQNCWLEKDDERILITTEFADYYRAYAALKFNPSCKTLCRWMSKNIFGHAVSFSDLCKTGLLRARLLNGIFIAELSAQKIKTTGLSSARWRQLLGLPIHESVASQSDDEPLSVRTQRQWKQRGHKSFNQSADKQYESILKRVKPVLEVSKHHKTAELTKLRLWLENENNSAEYNWEWLLTSWCYWLVHHGGQRKGHLSQTSVRRYMQFTRPLLQSLGAQDVWEGSSEQWLIAIEEAVIKAGAACQAASVERFVAFLVVNGIAPDLHISDIDLPNVQSNVDANMLVPADVELLLVSLRRFDSELARISRLLLCFGFACGLRRGEVLGLKKDNLRFCKLPYLALRNSCARSLKSTRGRRNLPLDLFWPDEEYQLLLDYSASHAVRQADLLFYDQPLALAALELLTDVLQEVTGQCDFRFHHLRHSYANWCFWLLHLPRIDERYTPLFFRHPWLSHQRSVFFRQRLGLSADLLARRDLHGLAILMGHGTPLMTMHSYIHISDIVNVAQLSPLKMYKGAPAVYRTPMPDETLMQITTGLVEQAHNKRKAKTASCYAINEIGQAIYQLSNSRHVGRDERVTPALLAEIDLVVSKGAANKKVKAVLDKVMRKKVPARVISRFRAWLELLDECKWEENFSKSQVEEIIDMTDPGKDFLFICRTIEQVGLLVRWLDFLETNSSEVDYRLSLATRCHRYVHSDNPLQQVISEVENDFHAGILKNLAAPKGRAKKRHPSDELIDKSTIYQQKFFTCEVHVRWDDIGNGEKRRNQALIAVLKAMWLSWRLREAL